MVHRWYKNIPSKRLPPKYSKHKLLSLYLYFFNENLRVENFFKTYFKIILLPWHALLSVDIAFDVVVTVVVLVDVDEAVVDVDEAREHDAQQYVLNAILLIKATELHVIP